MGNSKDQSAEFNSMASEMKETSEKYGTVADQRDMRRMGKTQKLRVSLASLLVTLAHDHTAELWLLQHLRVFVRKRSAKHRFGFDSV
jgi:hypothetical protein